MFVSIYEKTAAAALQRLVRLPKEAAGAEIRVDGFSRAGEAIDLDAFRNATDRLLIYTRRSTSFRDRATLDELSAAAGAGFDLVDAEVEQEYGILALPGSTSDFIGRWHDRALLSLHDYEGVPEELEAVIEQLEPFAPFKVAVTPRSFSEDLRVLEALRSYRARAAGYERPPQPGSKGSFASCGTIFGMGPQGLYSRILAPFFDSELSFVAADGETKAGPAQLTVDDAVSIYGDGGIMRPTTLFAVVGNPAAHSRSPMIHNATFRERRLPAAYSIIENGSFREVADVFYAANDQRSPFAPDGLSITAPFKEEAFQVATERSARLSQVALRARAVNTLVRMGDLVVAENTDVSGFARLIADLTPVARALVVGSGGTARAALVALEQLGIPSIITARDGRKGEQIAAELGSLFVDPREAAAAGADLVIDTLPASADLQLPEALRQARSLITADYTKPAPQLPSTVRLIGGQALLQAQAAGQSALFFQAIGRKGQR
jgi:shikimate 5-dehydrogenase/3-dehydroquinate dehydratase